ncbi:hypothetical protein P175DRAFT_0490961 [Aspergillus ochraceoroseus IBT 24754]|uniref:Uncharacterized protein n=1 Tax=Aspergillus ochraceoroseus IBT 24754 TaxID=1392256 RepID=A0A2T5M1U5_9EURO|nr:uncharacterized protein P175DRAFT_0490961 [Aspergillus ochraceoroseus IBT 24754]PTU22499.1 hypothetical protein P175DRAFT_0490961 [Aspergillus ochraceoroseus IBT 24754]
MDAARTWYGESLLEGDIASWVQSRVVEKGWREECSEAMKTSLRFPGSGGAQPITLNARAGNITENDIQGRLRSFQKAMSGFEIDLRISEPPSYNIVPPPYDDAVNDLPPQYSENAPLAQKQDLTQGIHLEGDSKPRSAPQAFDFEKPTGIRECKGKKKKSNAAKPPAPPPPANDPPPPQDNGGDKPDEGAGDSGGDAGGGGSNGDDGNGGGDGDGGDEDSNAWGIPLSKKAQKKKKKQEEEEEEKKKLEEEEKLKREEEEQRAKEEEERVKEEEERAKEEEERKAKEEEERKAAEEATAAKNSLSWADDAEGNGDDTWVGLGKKKKKKGKAELVDAEPPASSFQEVSLGDGVPQLDLGLDPPKNSGFSFGGWGKDWATGNKWGVDSLAGGNGKGNDDNNPWSPGGKNDPLKTSVGFDFGNFDNPATNGDATEAKNDEDDDWGMAPVSKKDKKKKNKEAELLIEPEPAPIKEPGPSVDNAWGIGLSKKEKRKAKKDVGKADEPAPDPISEQVDVAWDAPQEEKVTEVNDDNDWGWDEPTKKKDKKKKQEDLVFEELPAEPPKAPEPAPIENDWFSGATTKKKDKKAKKKEEEERKKREEEEKKRQQEEEARKKQEEEEERKRQEEEEEEEERKRQEAEEERLRIEEEERLRIEEEERKAKEEEERKAKEEAEKKDDGWGWGFTATDKKKKKKGKAALIPEPAPEPRQPTPPPEPEPKQEPEPELEPVVEPEPEPEPELEPWTPDFPDDPLYDNWLQLSSKERKRRERSLLKKGLPIPGKDIDLSPPKQDTALEPEPEAAPEPVHEDPPVPDPEPVPNENNQLVEISHDVPADDPIEGSWGIWGSSKDKKKSKKNRISEEPPPPAPTPPSWGLEREYTREFENIPEDPIWDDLDSMPSKPKKVPVEETIVKAAKGFWASIGEATMGKPKPTKKKSEENPRSIEPVEEAGEADLLIDVGDVAKEEPAPIAPIVPEAPEPPAAPAVVTTKTAAASSKIKPSTKLSVAERISALEKAKKEKLKEKAALEKAKLKEVPPPPPEPVEPPQVDPVDINPEPTKTKASRDSVPGSFPDAFDDEIDDFPPVEVVPEPKPVPEPEPEPQPEPPKKAKAEPILSKKEKKKEKKKGKLIEPEPEPEPLPEPVREPEPEPEPVILSKTEKKKKKKAKEPEPEPVLEPEPEPEQEIIPEPEPEQGILTKTQKKKKSKKVEPEPVPEPDPEPVILTKTEKKKKAKEVEPEPLPEPEIIQEYESAANAERAIDLEDEQPPAPKPEKMAKKSKKSSSSKKAIPPQDPITADDVMATGALEVNPDSLPTPPPEERPAKKERSRSERTPVAAPWGFWGATPPRKPTTREVRSSRNEASPALARSRSTKQAKVRESENEAERSSTSDKGRQRESRSSRGMTFSNFIFGAPPQPSRMSSSRKSGAHPSRRSSRHRPVDMNETGFPSPPPEDRDLPDKAAKMMGVNASGSKRDRTHGERRKSRARDPYIVDDDDLVVVNRDDIENPSKDGSRYSKHSGRGSRRSRSNAGELNGGEVMVEREPPNQAPDVASGPDDMAFVEAPSRERRMKRSNTTPKRPEPSGFMGLIGSLRRSTRPEPPERRKSRPRRDDDGRYPTETDRDESRHLKRDERRRRSVRPDTDGDGIPPEAAMAGAFPDTEAEDVEAKRAARRARRASRQAAQAAADELRETELRAAEERRSRRREEQAREREQYERQLREEEEREARRQEEKRARRAAREERRAREEQEAREAEVRAEAKAAERRERKRQQEAEMYENAQRQRRHQPRIDDRTAREFYMNGYDGDRARRSGEDGNRSRRRRSRARDNTRPTPMPLGARKDKTSSWIDRQVDEPPEAPQIVPTVLDMPPGAGEPLNGHSMSSDEEARRQLRRQARRRSKYPGLDDREIEEIRERRREARRAERGAKTSSGSGDYERERGPRYDGRYAPEPPPPAYANAKRPSWLKKLTTF